MLAQLDRVTDYESVGQGFESLAAHHKNRNNFCCSGFLFCKKGLEPPNGTTALRKRPGGSFLAGEICEYSSKSVRFCEAKAYSSPLQRTKQKKDTERCPFFVWCIDLNEEGNPDGFPFKLSLPSEEKKQIGNEPEPEPPIKRSLYTGNEKCYYFSIILKKR